MSTVEPLKRFAGQKKTLEVQRMARVSLSSMDNVEVSAVVCVTGSSNHLRDLWDREGSHAKFHVAPRAFSPCTLQQEQRVHLQESNLTPKNRPKLEAGMMTRAVPEMLGPLS